MTTLSPWQNPATIPEGLLLQIFTNLCHEEWPQAGSVSSRRPLLVSHVCQLWRKASVSNATLWRDIDFSNKKLAFLSLSRTGLVTPLYVRLTGRGGPAENINVYHCVRQRIANIRLLLIRPSDYSDLTSILRFFVNNPPLAGRLKTLYVSEEQNWRENQDKGDALVGHEYVRRPPMTRISTDLLNQFGHLESLRSVEDLLLDSIEVPLWSPAYDNLVHLDLFDFKPRLCPVELLRSLRRSPRLQTLTLDSAYGDIDSETASRNPSVELLELHTMNLTSLRRFRSTTFIVGQIYAPKLEHLDIDVTSDGQGLEFERLLAPLDASPFLDSIETLTLSNTSDPISSTPSLTISGFSHAHATEMMCSIRIHSCTWEAQYGRPTFLEYIPNILRIELLDDTCNIGKMLEDHPVQELMLSGHAHTRVLKHMRPGGRLAEVCTLELDCRMFGPAQSAEACVEWLRKAERLQLLRLYGYTALVNEDVVCFVEYGIIGDVEVEWAGSYELEPLMKPYPMPKSECGLDWDTDTTTGKGSKRKPDRESDLETLRTKRQKISEIRTPTVIMDVGEEGGFSMESVRFECPKNLDVSFSMQSVRTERGEDPEEEYEYGFSMESVMTDRPSMDLD